MKIIFILLIFLSGLIYAEVDERKSDVYFANGIDTEEADAWHATYSILQPAIKNKLYHGKDVKRGVKLENDFLR